MSYIAPQKKPGESTEEFTARLEKITADTEKAIKNLEPVEVALRKRRQNFLLIWIAIIGITLALFVCVGALMK